MLYSYIHLVTHMNCKLTDYRIIEMNDMCSVESLGWNDTCRTHCRLEELVMGWNDRPEPVSIVVRSEFTV